MASWSWLVSGQGPELLRSWQERLKEILAKPLEQFLSPYEWSTDFEQWVGEDEAKTWATAARRLSVEIQNACGFLGPKLAQVESVKHKYDDYLVVVRKSGIPPDVAVEPAVLAEWSEAFALEASLPIERFDWLPWSQRRRAIRRMKRSERALRMAFPLSVWRSIGKLTYDGRDKLSTIVEHTQLWLSIRAEWNATETLRQEIDSTLGSLRGKCADLTAFENIPDSPDLAKWQGVSQALVDMTLCADKATIAWHKRTLAEITKADIRAIASEFVILGSGIPIKESWCHNLGASFHAAISAFGAEPSPESVVNVRASLYTDAFAVLVESWERARDAHNLARRLEVDLEGVPSVRRRLDEWSSEYPAALSPPSQLPRDRLPQKTDAVMQLCNRYSDWCSRWNQFCNQLQPDLQKRSEDEYKWAVETLNEVLDLLPAGEQKTQTERAIHELLNTNPGDWPTAEIQSLFETYSPSRIKASIGLMEAQIEELSFDLAKQDWLRRMSADAQIQKALDDLHTHYKKNAERIEESAFPLFRKALEAVPIWITTAQSPQSIPMLPDVFDILVIDEATQCTVTNILPLIYRAKRLAVIGDPEQLPAIPNIGSAAEAALAAKYDIEENLLNVVGHAENDLYKASVRCLPGGRHDVIALEEHYRSHPLIIGFSNRHVYQTALKLRTDPAHVADLPFGSAVHGQHVSGHCTRGQFNTSWQNAPEAQAVCDLVKRLRQSPDSRSRSLGVVTPFRAQAEAIAERLHALDLQQDSVTVGTAHTYQGDERDIMIFSPVVARGIGDGAARWVENPKNLINVAVTRARLALFVVCDYDLCRAQSGILGDLVKYVETVEKLRQTSQYELELFSWMVVQGWNPAVHPVVGGIEVDFVLTHEGRRLVIEVDGSQHENTQQEDMARDAFLRGQGYDVLRIPVRAIREKPSVVIMQIGERIGLSI